MKFNDFMEQMHKLLKELENDTGVQVDSIRCTWIDGSTVGKSHGILKETMVTHRNPADRVEDPIDRPLERFH